MRGRTWMALMWAVLTVLAAASGSAVAAPTFAITVGPDPVESITTQLGVTGTASASDNQLFLTVKATGGQGCGANPQADSGNGLFIFTTVGAGPFSENRNWTFDSAGSYLLCAWITDNTQNDAPVVATATTTAAVRPPHLALSVAVPAKVAPGRTFQLATTAQAETQRSVYEWLLPDTHRGCPANSGAAGDAAGTLESINGWNVTGGPTTYTENEHLDQLGRYLVCAYFDYGSLVTPEATAIASVTAAYSCVVPRHVAGRSLATVERRIRGAHCRVGTIRRVASRRYRRGLVVALGVAAGTVHPGGTAVGIAVSSGPPRRRRHR